MTVYDEPGYKTLEGAWEIARENLAKAVAALDQRRIDRNNTLRNLNSWKNAGNSDMRNKMERIGYWNGQLAEVDADIAKLEEDVEIAEQRERVAKSGMDTFVHQYNQAIINGKSSQDAGNEATAKANAEILKLEDELRPDAIPVWVWFAGGAVVVAIILYFILRK